MGDIIGPMDRPWERDSVSIDATGAVLLAAVDVATMVSGAQGTVVALVLTGRINKTTEHSKMLYLLNADAAAGLVSELIAISVREGGEFEREFSAQLEARMQAMRAET